MTSSDENPYESPLEASPATSSPAIREFNGESFVTDSPEHVPAISTTGTVVPRHIAALIDNTVAMLLAVVVAKTIDEQWRIAQFIVALIVYLGYYLLSEGLVARSPGKLLTGLIVTQFNGEPCTWRQTIIRTCLRVLEVNPLLLGFIPAAVCILFSRHHQRIGDRIARTIVVPSHLLRM